MVRATPLGLALLLLAFLAACESATPPQGSRGELRPAGRPYWVNGVQYVPRHDPDYAEVGVASWYGPGFHGRKTASGERFDMHAMTAAHKTLPFGTRVRVTNLHNERSVVVTINDRGPFIRGRIIDLSMQAAERLGFRLSGKARVRVEVLDDANG